MVKVICQHSNIEFEAKTARTKQHPLVADMKTRANKDGNYREVLSALDTVRRAGGYETIEQYVQMVRDHISGKKTEAKERAQKQADREARAAARKKEFEAWLPANGYTSRTETKQTREWVENPHAYDEYSAGDYVTRTTTYTIWTAPDGLEIDKWTAEQIFNGKLTLEAHRAAQQAEIDAKAARKAEEVAREKAHEESLKVFDAQFEAIKQTSTQIDRDVMQTSDEYKHIKDALWNAEVVTHTVRGTSSYRPRDTIRMAVVDGVKYWLVLENTGYDDDGYSSYWRENQQKKTPTEIKADKKAKAVETTKTTLNDPHALNISALLRHTVNNPRFPTMPIKYHAWGRINRMLWSRPIDIHKSEVSQFIQDFSVLLASISEHAHLSVTVEDIAWLVNVLQNRDSLTLSLLMAMSTMTPPDDMIGLNEVADMLGHKSTSTLRTWIGEGRFYSAVKPGGRDWLLAKSEIKLRNDI